MTAITTKSDLRLAVLPAIVAPETAVDSLDDRWAAWQARGRRSDIRSQRLMRVIAAIAAIGLAVASGWAVWSS